LPEVQFLTDTNPFNFSKKLAALADDAEKLAAQAFGRIEQVERFNTQKVLGAFCQHRISTAHLAGSTGYGYGDMGRDALDALFASVMGAEDALVRHALVSGTHALGVALFGLLRPGDTLLSLTGAPYDTLADVIGIGGGKNQGSLLDFNVKYSQVDLCLDGTVDAEKAAELAGGAAVAYLQRSRGYSLRPSIMPCELEAVCAALKRRNPQLIILVDNCYGEFVCTEEPLFYGADIIAGSLIKNAGGGIARTGGYIAGRKELVERCSYRLSVPGAGREVGCSLDELRNMYMGLFLAPSTVAAALKTAVFASALFGLMGYECTPGTDEPRSDIIQAVCLREARSVLKFCRGIQGGSPIDSFASPEPWDMPGYDCPVVMASGAFTQGSSIELSADAPMREPFAVWLQGGLTYPSGRLGVMLAAKQLLDD
jgi:cystathionine beta-lyase family protein involved in aluminum resistance